MTKPELLAPAGNLEKLKMAIVYGADAVYVGGKEYGLRAKAGNFDLEDLSKGLKFVHSHGKKLYLTMNIIPHNTDFKNMPRYIKQISELGVDAVILSDPGVYSMVREINPYMEIHLSTQANNTNWRSAKFWNEKGVKRIILARELTLDEIREISKKAPGVELEVFIHGSMCISYSGRCLLSNYMAGRDSNRGMCAHPCRWKYHLAEQKRPGEFYPVYEDERGTFIFNSKDLCMIEHIPEILESGVSGLKIEGRMKSSCYVATVVRAYRNAIDKYLNNPDVYKFDSNLLDEVSKVSHREFTTGFYFGKPDESAQNYSSSSYIREYDFIGIVLDYDQNIGVAKVEQRNRMFTGDTIEITGPGDLFFEQKITCMKNDKNLFIDSAPHPQMIVYIPMEKPVRKYSLLRRKSNK